MDRAHAKTMLFVLIGVIPLVVAGAGVASFLLLRAGYGLVVGALLPFAVSLLMALEVRDYFFFTSSCSMCSLISSRTLQKMASRSSSEPSARAGSSKDQCRRFLAPGKKGQASLAS